MFAGRAAILLQPSDARVRPARFAACSPDPRQDPTSISKEVRVPLKRVEASFGLREGRFRADITV